MSTKRKKTGLVLGGGGLIGMAYHAGTLKALDDAGFSVEDADLIVGTSAGSVIGAYLASGWAQTDFYEYAYKRHPNAHKDPEDDQATVRELFEPLWKTGSERARRWIGSAYALASSRGIPGRLLRGRTPIRLLRKGFPSGLYSTTRTKERLIEELPPEWPERDLQICTVDLYTGKRVAFGAPGAPTATPAEAVLASTAIPGVYPAVRIGDHSYVDGGAYSATSLDLAVEAGCTSVICIAPLGYRSSRNGPVEEPKIWLPMVARALFARALAREVNLARSKGVDVLVFRPWTDDLPIFGTNAMRHFDRARVVETAREGTHKLLEEHSDHPALEPFAVGSTDTQSAAPA